MHTTSLIALLAIAGSSILPSLAVPTPGNTLQYFETRDIIGELQRRADVDLLTRGKDPVPVPDPTIPTTEPLETPANLSDDKKDEKKKKKKKPRKVTTREVADDELFTREKEDKDADAPTTPAPDADDKTKVSGLKKKRKPRTSKKNTL